MRIMKLFSLSLCLLLTGCAAISASNSTIKAVSPYDYGLRNAKTGVEAFWALYNAHSAAVAAGTDVTYEGIERLEIEIPKDAKSIPLTSNNDFMRMELIVKNNSKDFFLFTKESPVKNITVDKKDIDSGNFTKYEELRRGKHVLKVVDKNLWVDNRKGYTYGHTRKDILLINNGKADNNVIYPYNNEESNPTCTVFDADNPIVVKRLDFKRAVGSTFKTFLFCIQRINDVNICDVTATTPSSDIVDDYMMRIYDCTNVTFDRVSINGTYSRKDHSGYGIELNNVWNFKANKLTCSANWGIFGNNNVNLALLEDCAINRFDVHCYGKDIYFKNVSFDRLYNQFSSVFGEIIFEKCKFDNFVPVLYEAAYNAFTPHDIYFNQCEATLTTDHNYLINTGHISVEKNRRKPVSEKCFPNVVINDMVVNVPSGVKEMIIFREGTKSDKGVTLDYIERISINGLKFISKGKERRIDLKLSNLDMATSKELRIDLKNIEVYNANENKKDNKVGTITIGMNRTRRNNQVTTKKIKDFKIKD